MATLFFSVTDDITFCFLTEDDRDSLGPNGEDVIMCSAEIPQVEYDKLMALHTPRPTLEFSIKDIILCKEDFTPDEDMGFNMDGAHDEDDLVLSTRSHFQVQPNQYGGLKPIDFEFDTAGIA